MIDFIQYFKIDNIDFLACNTLNNPDYKTFYEKLQYVCIVGASNDKTGNIKYGGDWIMESTGEDIESIYFTKNIEYYTYLLDTYVEVWARSLNMNGNSAYSICILNGCLVMSTTDTYGSLIVHDNSKLITADGVSYDNNRRYYPLRSTDTGEGYIAYGMTSITLQYNLDCLFAITSTKTSDIYYISYVKGTVIVSTSGTFNAVDGTSLFNGNTTTASQNWLSISNVNANSGIVSYDTDKLFVGLTNGNIMRIKITDIDSNIPTSVQNATWCNTGTDAIHGMAVYNHDLYAINSIGTIFKINILTSVFTIITTVLNGTSLAILNNYLFVSVQTQRPTSGTLYGSGNITRINLYDSSRSIIHNSSYYTSSAPANLGLCVYVNGSNEYIFSLAIITSGIGSDTYEGITSFGTKISRFTIDPISTITTVSSTSFDYNEIMYDVSNVMFNTTNNKINMPKNTNYMISKNNSKIENILLIDSTIKQYEEVIDSINNNTIAIVYDYNYTFENLSNVLIDYNVSRIGIFCHSNASFFNNKYIYDDVSGWNVLIQQFKIEHIDFLSCNTLKIPEYITFYAKLPCIVGASNDETGNIKYGGDWVMETTGEDIESIYFTKSIEYYTYLLAADSLTANWANPINMGGNAAYAMCILNDCLVISESVSAGTIIVYSNSYINLASAGNNRNYYNFDSLYAFGLTTVSLPYNSNSLFAITSNARASGAFYISYVKGSLIASSGTLTTNGTNLFTSSTTNSAKKLWYTISNVNNYSGIVSYQQNIYIGLTNGYIMSIAVTDVTGSIPTHAVNTAWCYTGVGTAIRGMAIDNYNLYAINASGTIFKINLSDRTCRTFATVSTGTSLSISNKWLFISLQSTLPTTQTSLGTGAIKKIALYTSPVSVIDHDSTPYSSVTPANLSLCSYVNGSTNYLFSLAIITARQTGGPAYSAITAFQTKIAKYIINNAPLINITSTSFNFNFNGNTIDISNLMINSTDNLNNIGQNTRYNILNSEIPYELGILYQNSATPTLNTIETNYYIFIGGAYRDISNYFTLSSSYVNYRTPALLTTYNETYIFQSITRYSDVNTNGYIPLSSYGTGTYKISCIANNTSIAKIYTYNAPFTRYRLYLGVLCMGGGGSGNTSFAGGGGGYCYSEILLVGGAQYSISVGGVGSATSITYSGNSNTANGGSIGNATGTAGGGSSSVNLGINSFTITGGNNVTNGIANGTTFYNNLRNNNYTFFTWMNDYAIVGTIPNVVCGGGSGGNNTGNAGYNDGNGTSLIDGTSTNAQTTGSIGGGYSNGGGKNGSGGGGIIYLFYNTVQMIPKFNVPPINVTGVTSDHLFYYIMNNDTTAITNTIVMPFTAYAYIICIGGGGSSSDGIGGSGGAFVYAEIPLLGGKTYTITVGGPSQASTFTDDISTISAGGSSGTLNGIATNTFTSSNIIQYDGNAGEGINGGINIIGLSINSDFKNDIKNNSTLTDYDNNIPIGCGAYGNSTDYNGTSVYVDTNGNSQYRIDSTQYSSIYTPDPVNNFTGTGTGNGGGGNGINSGGGGIIMIYF
jgi:hypothetical protein